MLELFIENFNERKFAKQLNTFFYSVYFLALAGILAAASNIFGLELFVWYGYLILWAAVVLCARDALPLAPLVLFIYITVSTANNPAKYYGESLFQRADAMVQIIIILVIAAALFVARIAADFKRMPGRTKGTMPMFTAGLVILGAAYAVSGALSGEEYAPQWKSTLFGLVQIAALALPYFYFYYTVDWKRAPKYYYASLFTVMGLAVSLEVVALYMRLPEGEFMREYLNTGWGIYNNVGFVIAFCIPMAFLLSAKKERGWIYFLVAEILATVLLFTQSRGSILFGGLMAIASAVLVLFATRGKERKMIATVGCAYVLLLGIAMLIFRHKLIEVFTALSDAGFDDSNRFNIYKTGFSQFVDDFMFGGGFYACQNYRYGNLPDNAFLPPRYHNTVVQLLATGGIFAMAAYTFHRLQTLHFVLKNPSYEKTFVGFSILVLTLTSLVDCHFFNFAPGLMYSFLLVSAERSENLGLAYGKENCPASTEETEPDAQPRSAAEISI